MIPAISPDVFRDKKHRKLKWTVSVAAYALGATLTGSVVGAGLGWLGSWLPVLPFAPIGLAVLAFLYSLRELSLLRVPLPQIGKQAPSGWRVRFHPWLSAYFYGAYFGLCVLHLSFVSTFFVVLLWAFVIADPLASAAIMGAYGFSQALPIAFVAWRVDSPDRAYDIGRAVVKRGDAVHRINGLSLAAAAAIVMLVPFL
ncbi:MAG TPA: hypothetical protein VFB62_10815 [Polyangiaceae bacterium]|nr:hypothetical protein [Polyangiaceae bacterium]